MKIEFKVDCLCYKIQKNEVRVFHLEFLPGVAYRHITGGFGYEYNFYVSWLAWVVSVTLYGGHKK